MKRLFTKFKVSGQSELIALLDWRKPDTQLQRKHAQRWEENRGSSSSTINTRSLSSLTSCRHLPRTSRSAKLLGESRRVCLQVKPTAIYQFWWTTQTRYPIIRRGSVHNSTAWGWWTGDDRSDHSCTWSSNRCTKQITTKEEAYDMVNHSRGNNFYTLIYKQYITQYCS